jgi:hypothetical protein
LLARGGSKVGVIVALGTTQMLAWASSYYIWVFPARGSLQPFPARWSSPQWWGHAWDGLSTPLVGAKCWPLQTSSSPAQYFEQRRLSGAVGPDQSLNLPAANVKAHMIQRESCAEAPDKTTTRITEVPEDVASCAVVDRRS